jgi:hypothetical protein
MTRYKRDSWLAWTLVPALRWKREHELVARGDRTAMAMASGYPIGNCGEGTGTGPSVVVVSLGQVRKEELDGFLLDQLNP